MSFKSNFRCPVCSSDRRDMVSTPIGPVSVTRCHVCGYEFASYWRGVTSDDECNRHEWEVLLGESQARNKVLVRKFDAVRRGCRFSH